MEEAPFKKYLKVKGELGTMFPFSNFVYLYMFKFVYSMSIETTDDCGQDPYETGCLVETVPGLINIRIGKYNRNYVR